MEKTSSNSELNKKSKAKSSTTIKEKECISKSQTKLLPIEFESVGTEIESRLWLENSPVCTKIIDSDFNLQYMSRAGIDGLKIKDVNGYYGKPYPFYFFPEHSKKIMVDNLNKAKDSGIAHSVETTAFDLDGNELWFHSSLTPIKHPDGSLDHIMVVSSDITKRKHAEEKVKLKNSEIIRQNNKYEKLNEELIKTNAKLTLAKEKAEESEKLKAAFLANMSHEIRTPLNSILGFASILKSNISIDKNEKKEYLEYIELSGNRLLRIISDIVDISKIEANQMSIFYEEHNLNQLIDSLQIELSNQFNNISVPLITSKALPNDNCNVKIDKVRLSQILSNLIENANNHTKKGQIEFGYTIKDHNIKFYVKDSGIGIDPKEHEIIFERFRQVNHNQFRTRPGTGLGLPIAKELINLMDGNIWLESKLGEGSTFYFTIPLQKMDELSLNDITTAEENINNSNKTVLIAEDENMNYLYLKTLLKGYGFNVLRAKNGQEALELVQNEIVDLVFMDTRMPKLNGLDATLKIREINKTIPIIAQTAYAMSEDKKKALEVGQNDYLTKPISKNELDKIVKKHLG